VLQFVNNLSLQLYVVRCMCIDVLDFIKLKDDWKSFDSCAFVEHDILSYCNTRKMF